MNIIRYVKKNGIRHTWDIFYKYKADKIIQKILGVFLKHKPLQDIIIIESHNDFDCNGGALYEYLLENNFNQKYKIVLFLKNEIPKKLPYNVIGVPLHKPSIKKCYYMWLGKYFLNDCHFVPKLRNDQMSIYCTHGPIGLKNPKGLMELPKNLDYCLAPSHDFASIIADIYGLKNPDKQFIYMGYPKHDVLYEEGQGDLTKVLTQQYAKVILWMPTFRKGGGFRRDDSTIEQPLGIPLIEDMSMYDKLNSFLAQKNCMLIIKIHPMQDLSVLQIGDMSNIKVLTGKTVKELGVDNSRLMKDVDALISDYSAVAYDFLHCDKPIAYMLNDEKDYKLGFIVENPDEIMAGHKIYTYDELEKFILDVVEGKDPYKEKRKDLFAKVFKYHDGNSCKRLVEFLGL